MNGRENDYCLDRTFCCQCLWFLLFFISTSVQRQGVTDDFLELVPPHPFIHAFTFSLWLFFSSSLLFRAFFPPTHNKWHYYMDISQAARTVHKLYVSSILCMYHPTLSLYLSFYLSFSFLYVYNSNSWVLSLCKHYPESILLRRKRRLALIELIIQQKCKERKINLLISISIAILFFLDKLLVVCVYMHYPSYYS